VDKSKKIPNHWKWVTLEDIGIVVSGGTPSTKESEFWNGDIPWITPADLSDHKEIYISKGSRNISKVGLDYSSAYLLPENSVVFSSRAPIGYVAITQNKLATNQGFKNLILSTNSINSKYVYYYLKTVKELAENMSSGTTFLELSATQFKQIPFPFAPIEEQNRIVGKIEELFSELDKNLELFEKSLKDVENLWTITLNKALGDTNNLVNLQSLVQIKGGKRLPKNFNYSEYKTDYPYIRVSDFSNYSVDESNLKYISEEVYEKLKNYSIDSENVYISIAGTIGLVGSIPNNLSNAILTENAAKFIFDSKELLKDYLIYLLDSPFIKEQINKSVKATSQPKLALYKILEFKIPKHTISEQKAIVEKLEEFKTYCANLKESINENYFCTVNVKNKILQEAFQGKLSLPLVTDTSIEVLLKKIIKEKEEYLEEQQEIIKKHPKIKRMEKEKLSIIQVLEKNKNPISPKQLWEDSMYSDSIERFYSELKNVQDKIIEEKTEKGSLISLK
jgi:type I restriction enzyme S subunit